MAGVHIETDVREVLSLAELIADSALEDSDRINLLKGLGVEMERQSQDRFDSKTDPEGRPWKTIAESTQLFYEKYFPQAQPPLIRTGDLRDRITSFLKGSWSIKTGSDMEYAPFIQKGTSRMPARKVFGLSPSDMDELRLLTLEFLEARI